MTRSEFLEAMEDLIQQQVRKSMTELMRRVIGVDYVNQTFIFDDEPVRTLLCPCGSPSCNKFYDHRL